MAIFNARSSNGSALRLAVIAAIVVAGLLAAPLASAVADDFAILKFQQPGVAVDLGVGLWAWPLPMDFDGDGDLDLVVSCPDKPYNGTYFFENSGRASDGQPKMPLFLPAVRVGPGYTNIQASYVDGKPRVLVPGKEVTDLVAGGFKSLKEIYPKTNIHPNKLRANQWRYVDYDGDDKLDLVVGTEDWTEYGWDDAFDATGKWTRGPLHGNVYWLRNTGSTAEPKYAEPVQVESGGKPIDTFGMPSPSFADFDGDGDLDLICGEFLDGFTYYENIGTRKDPKYDVRRRLKNNDGLVQMDLEMITPVAIDWDRDGDMDLICGDEDGRVAFIEHTGEVIASLPRFAAPQYFEQEADLLKFGALATPVGCDWDGDGDEDLVAGNTAGYVGFFENLGGYPPRFAPPKLLEADGQTIRIEAGPNGSIQGPAEAKWGYTTLAVADWDQDGKLDIVANSIWGKVVWYQNVGQPNAPQLTAARPIEVEWKTAPPKPAWTWWQPQGRELVTQWRTTPNVFDVNGDGLNDLVMLDHEGFLACFQRTKIDSQVRLLPPRRLFVDPDGKPLQLNAGRAGKSGRRKLTFADWDGDGRIDLLINSTSANFYKNMETRADGSIVLADQGPVAKQNLQGHDTSPTTVDWNRDGLRDLVIGAEDGHFYYLENPRTDRTPKQTTGIERATQGDPLYELQTAAIEQNSSPIAHWGPDPKKYISWSNHSNRLIPVYTFGTKGAGAGVDLTSYTGEKSIYRREADLAKLYGRPPSNTVCPTAEYMDQTEIAALQRAAFQAGKKHVILVVFDGMDWQTTQAAAMYQQRTIPYREGRGTGLHILDYDAGGTSQYGFMVTAPHNDGTKVDVNTQTVSNPGGKQPGGYNPLKLGPYPWSTPVDRFYPIGLAGKSAGEHAFADSAATATSMVTGKKTYNYAINVGPTGEHLVSIAHEVQARGIGTGVVTSVPIAHATPASMYAHNVSRNDYQDMTRDLLGLPSISHPDKPLPGLDVLIGGGYGDMSTSDKGQGKNYVPGNQWITDADMQAVDLKHGGKYVVAQRTPGVPGGKKLRGAVEEAIESKSRLFGFFGVGQVKGHLPFATADGDFHPAAGKTKRAEHYTEADLVENPTLAEMATAALDVLAENPHGFWLLVEAGEVDWANHDNNLDNAIGAVLSGDAAVKAITEWVERHSNWQETVMIVTSDHGHYLVIDRPELFVEVIGGTVTRPTAAVSEDAAGGK